MEKNTSDYSNQIGHSLCHKSRIIHLPAKIGSQWTHQAKGKQQQIRFGFSRMTKK